MCPFSVTGEPHSFVWTQRWSLWRSIPDLLESNALFNFMCTRILWVFNEHFPNCIITRIRKKNNNNKWRDALLIVGRKTETQFPYTARQIYFRVFFSVCVCVSASFAGFRITYGPTVIPCQKKATTLIRQVYTELPKGTLKANMNLYQSERSMFENVYILNIINSIAL